MKEHKWHKDLMICKCCAISYKDYVDHNKSPVVHRCHKYKSTTEDQHGKRKTTLQEKMHLKKIFLNIELSEWAREELSKIKN